MSMDAQSWQESRRSQHEALRTHVNSLHAQRLEQLDQAATSHRERGARLKQVLSEHRRILHDLSKSMETKSDERKDGLIDKLGGLSQFFKQDFPAYAGNATSRYESMQNTKSRRKNFKVENPFLTEDVSQTDSSMCNFEAGSDLEDRCSEPLDVFDASAIPDQQTPRLNTPVTSARNHHEHRQSKLIRNGMILDRGSHSKQRIANKDSPISDPDQLNLVDSIHLDVLDQDGLHFLWTMEKEFAVFFNRVKHLEHTMQAVSSSLHHTLQRLQNKFKFLLKPDRRQNIVVSELRGGLLEEVKLNKMDTHILSDLSFNQLNALKNAVGSLKHAKEQLEQQLIAKDQHIKVYRNKLYL